MKTIATHDPPTQNERMRIRLAALNICDAESAALQFRRCCASGQWVRGMTSARPFDGIEEMESCADHLWAQCPPGEWLAAFAAHPKIGAREGSEWSKQEQAAAMSAAAAVQQELAQANREYEEKFGFIFIVCATGKSSAEMLEILRGRMRNTPGMELREAAEQQRLITRLRLRKLLSE
jgi:2-oxo-4-hydroxy-4-carboxy-5-ureidoimidazoline decarboxylase